jgi:hypothetical protein
LITLARGSTPPLGEKKDATNKLLADLLESNLWFTTKLTDAVEKKIQSIVNHHENMVKSAQHHRLAPEAFPLDVLDEILNHNLSGEKKKHGVRQTHRCRREEIPICCAPSQKCSQISPASQVGSRGTSSQCSG